MDTSSVAMFYVDMRGRITKASQRMAEMFGYAMRELEGIEYASLIHPEHREESRTKMLAFLSSRIPDVEVDRLYWRSDQSEFWGHLTGKRFYDANGANCWLIGVIADITKRTGMNDFLIKPFEPETLFSTLLRSLESRGKSWGSA